MTKAVEFESKAFEEQSSTLEALARTLADADLELQGFTRSTVEQQIATEYQRLGIGKLTGSAQELGETLFAQRVEQIKATDAAKLHAEATGALKSMMSSTSEEVFGAASAVDQMTAALVKAKVPLDGTIGQWARLTATMKDIGPLIKGVAESVVLPGTVDLPVGSGPRVNPADVGAAPSRDIFDKQIFKQRVREGFEGGLSDFLRNVGREGFKDAGIQAGLGFLETIRQHFAEKLVEKISGHIFDGAAPVVMNTTATELNTLALQNLTAVMSFSGGFNRPGAEVNFDDAPDWSAVEKNLDGVNTGTHEILHSVGLANSGLSAIDYSVNMAGFNTVNALHELGNVIVASRPQGPGLVGQLLGAFVGALGSQLGAGLSGSLFGDDEGGITDTSSSADTPYRPNTRPRYVNPPSRALGGPVKAGEVYETHGLGKREFLIPGTDGRIVTQNQMRETNFDFSHTNNFNNTQPRTQELKHTGSITIREDPFARRRRPDNVLQRRSRREIQEALLKYLLR